MKSVGDKTELRQLRQLRRVMHHYTKDRTNSPIECAKEGPTKTERRQIDRRFSRFIGNQNENA